MIKKIYKIIISCCLVIACCLTLNANVFAANNNCADQIYNCDNLPQQFDENVTFDAIEDDILNYIETMGLNIEIGSSEYLELMYSFLYDNVDNVTELTSRYFGDYASVYVVRAQEIIANNSINTYDSESENYNISLTGTIQQAKQQNINYQEQLENDVSIAPLSTNASYDVSKAQKYAEAYALSWNYVYGRYQSDCTNFASQIVNYAGMPMVSGEWQFNGNDTAQYTWNVAHAFTEYWTLVRGYNGGDYTSRSSVNQKASPGDFVAYMRYDTYAIWHVTFMQSKLNGEIYISQHTTDRYNEKWNDISINHDSCYIIIKFT